jgi:hypothetical protein
MLKATHTGQLFAGLLDCYVLEDERRVVSQRGVVRALTGSATGSAPLGRYLDRLPARFAHLAAQPEIAFASPTGPAKGRSVEWLSELLDAYVDAFMAGELHATQVDLARQARAIQSAAAKIGWTALVDEATGYQDVRETTALSFMYRALLLESRCQWDLMWPADFAEAVCRLHDEPFDGTQPRFLASTYEKLYRLVLGEEVYAELKSRNPEPSFGTNHHQWLTPEAREVVRKQVPILTALAETCGNKEEFWARVEHRYAKRPLQLSWFAPKRAKDDGEAA